MADYTKILENLMARYSEGGEAVTSGLADVEVGKGKAIASGMQRLISGGLAGTTIAGSVPIAAEETAGRARLAVKGQAEGVYTGIASQLANLQASAAEAEKQRLANRQNLLTQLRHQETMQTQATPQQIIYSGLGLSAPDKFSIRGETLGSQPSSANLPSLYSSAKPIESPFMNQNLSKYYPSIQGLFD